MRCPDCGKFVSLETSDPEMQNEELTDDGQVELSVRLTRNCADCSNELKETTFDLSDDHSEDIEAHIKAHHPNSLTDDGDEPRPTFTLEIGNTENSESGGGRYAKNMIGVSIDYEIRCDVCDRADDKVNPDPVTVGNLSDSIPASGFDEM